MVIVYASKTGFTKKYADLLCAKTGMQAFSVKELAKVQKEEEIIFLGWIKVGKIQGLKRLRKHNVKAVCASGTARTAEPKPETLAAKNNWRGMPFFYLRGGCFPLKQIRGMDRIMLSMFAKMLKSREEKSEEIEEAISIIENGFDGVNEAYLAPVLEWLQQ